MSRTHIYEALGYDRECQVYEQEDGVFLVDCISIESQQIIDRHLFSTFFAAVNYATHWVK